MKHVLVTKAVEGLRSRAQVATGDVTQSYHCNLVPSSLKVDLELYKRVGFAKTRGCFEQETSVAQLHVA